MLRRWLSGFWRDYKEKIKKLGKLFGMLLLIGFSAGTIFSTIKHDNTNQNIVKQVYTPSKTVISGTDISEEEFEKEENLVNTFVDYCNAQNYSEAYNLLTQECKNKLYPTLEAFKTNYCEIIFEAKREYNMQSWINDVDYNTYKVRFTEDFISTGSYNESEKYEDYITIVTNGQDKKINVNGYIKTVSINKQTKTEELEIEALSADVYLDYIEYYIKAKNISNKNILLDTLSSNDNIKLIGSNSATYRLYTTNLSMLDLKINANSSKNIKIKFVKQYGSDINGQSIEFRKAITDYSEYQKDEENYNNYKTITVKL